ncbi:unnamed protein product [Urochloa humidicola]
MCGSSGDGSLPARWRSPLPSPSRAVGGARATIGRDRARPANVVRDRQSSSGGGRNRRRGARIDAGLVNQAPPPRAPLTRRDSGLVQIPVASGAASGTACDADDRVASLRLPVPGLAWHIPPVRGGAGLRRPWRSSGRWRRPPHPPGPAAVELLATAMRPRRWPSLLFFSSIQRASPIGTRAAHIAARGGEPGRDPRSMDEEGTSGGGRSCGGGGS